MYYQLFDPITQNIHYYKVTEGGILHINYTLILVNILPVGFDLSTAAPISSIQFWNKLNYVLNVFNKI